MKFVLAKEHHDFFDTQGFIQFEGLLSPVATEKLLKATKEAVGTKLKYSPERLYRESPAQVFLSGRDLWRNHPENRKVCTNQNIAGIIANLTRQKPVRLLLDQWIPPALEWDAPLTLEQIVPVQGILGGAFIALDSACFNSEETPPFFPTEAGNMLFVKPDLPLPLAELTKLRNQNFLLVAYGSHNSVYIHKETDPLSHYLKNLDYVYGDRLSDNLHPIVLR